MMGVVRRSASSVARSVTRSGVLERRSGDNIAVLLKGAEDEYQYLLNEALDAERFSDDNAWVGVS
jgi:hypothetical protein